MDQPESKIGKRGCIEMERVRKPHHGDGGTEGVRMGRGSVGLVRVNGRPDWIERGSSHLAADHPHHHLLMKYKKKNTN